MYSASTAEMERCGLGVLEHTRYFARQLVTPAELNLDAAYFAERMRRHNRMLHGWGVVCGAQVCRVRSSDGHGAEPWKVKVRPGFAIDGLGNEISIGSERIFDLRSSSVVVMCGDPDGELSDPWCSDVWTEREPGPIWLAVCYKQCLSRPVRVQPAGCGCDDSDCEYSRWQDGYELRVLDSCPPSHRDPPDWEEFVAGLEGPLPDCPPCPNDPCVVLARIEVEADGTITAIDNCSCRRMVASFATFWWQCAAERLSVTRITGKRTYKAGDPGTLTVHGAHFRPGITADVGPGVRVTGRPTVGEGGKKLTVKLAIAKSAEPGDRTLTIENPDCSTATFARALTVAEAS